MLGSLDLVAEVHAVVADLERFPAGRSFDVLVVACEDVGVGSLDGVVEAAHRRGVKILHLIGRGAACLDAVTRLPSNGFLIQDEVTREALGQALGRMLISQHGVKRLVASVSLKLNCSNRTLAAAVAIKQGLLEKA
ncbi:hypothetical protein [Micromonospora sp. NPDC048830]|uniref:hypothetical protein n=1 Tax=Micromonospora sp. NPDC048830 TaxID=3364257 RepID=UPI003713F156